MFGWVEEFKTFAIKGNVIDLAVGLIIGAEFSKIVNSMVNDVIMPPIGLLIGGVGFNDLFVMLKEGAKVPPPYATLADAQAAGAVTLNFGSFLSTMVTFTITAFAVFLLVKIVNRARKA
ncbi:MAG TPA: large conductance mechanosensitive channel protein MscL [Bdellovibrionales bacterium]|nr:large conductance mechanosensitive channel protein MscL [Bdellovibrionales bacterium]